MSFVVLLTLASTIKDVGISQWTVAFYLQLLALCQHKLTVNCNNCLYACACQCTAVIHNMAQNSSDNLSCYLPDSQTLSVIYNARQIKSRKRGYWYNLCCKMIVHRYCPRLCHNLTSANIITFDAAYQSSNLVTCFSTIQHLMKHFHSCSRHKHQQNT